MKIALDYDGTYTVDPELWDRFILTAQGRGHDIRLVTFRKVDELTEDMTHVMSIVNDTICTGRIPKKRFCEEVGWEPNVWIDDTPILITEGSNWTPEEYATWRKSVKEAQQGE